ncbi:Multidrug resistance efflux pump [Desulfuromonas soudanensis]|uniref:Multidrug resistance efflux pump n=1 Tax=Desulfuromonas soudanensis TaxID=1603606 RepID=A0A0M5IRP7_9BACT|nr:HlyD family efflux transporter periplasmic adaptor subunit [Desulfuromonas soudanensis]ALC17344.1 Multidrug resistance efflux pump [Desulfuromonas soudanensis]
MSPRSLILFPAPVALAALLLCACGEPEPITYQGYAEGEYLYVSSPLGGELETLGVSRGETVVPGAPLFTLERGQESAAMEEAALNLRQAENRLADLAKGDRPSELAALEARLDRARTASQLARKEWERRRRLFAEKTISAEDLDQAVAAREQSAAAVDELRAELTTARLGGRSDVLDAARAEVGAARQRLAQARWRFEQKRQDAPQGGAVFDTLYVAGEFVPAGYPVVSLLPPQNILLRFFVPENVVGTLSLGQSLSVSFDGAEGSYPARINYISPQAEYTPPVIYSRQSRAKLVYLIEARPDPEDAADFHPGQPLDVRLEAAP